MKSTITLTERQRNDLETLIAPGGSARLRKRAQAVLWLSEGRTVTEVAEILGTSRQTVYNWAKRVDDSSGFDLMACLRDAPHTGRPRSVRGVIEPLINAVINGDPRDLGYRHKFWSEALLVRHLRDAHGLTVSRKSVSLAIDRIRRAGHSAGPPKPLHAQPSERSVWEELGAVASYG